MMEAEAERARRIGGLCFIFNIEQRAATALLDQHGIDYDALLTGGPEYVRARSLLEGVA